MKIADDIVRKTAKGIVYVAAQNSFYQGVNLLVFIVLARLLDPVDFGLVALTLVYIAFLQLFQDQGFTEAVVQARSLSSEFLSTAFWSNLGFSIFLFLATNFGSKYIAKLFGEERLEPLLVGLAPLFLIRGISAVQIAILKRQMDFRSIAAASMLGVSCGGTAGVVAAFSGLGVWSLVIFQLTNRLCESAVLWLRSNWKPSLRFKKEEWIRLFRYGGNIAGSELVNFANRYGADLIIGFVLGPVAVGLFSVSFRIVRTSVTLVGSIVSNVSFPVFARLQDDKKRGRDVFVSFIEQVSLVAFPVFVGLGVCAKLIILIVFGNQWINAVSIVQVLSAIGMIQSLFYINTSVILGFGKPHWQFGINSINAVANLFAFSVSAPFGVYAVALSYVLRGYLLAPIQLVAISKLIFISFLDYIKIILPPLSAACTMGVFILLSRFVVADIEHISARLAIEVTIGITVYFLAISAIAPNLLKKTIHYTGKILS